MMENGLRDALKYMVELGADVKEPKVLEICGHTYAVGDLRRYDTQPKAEPVKAATLTAMVDYIKNCGAEFGKVLIHVVSPTKVRVISDLDTDRNRETLFVSEAEVSEFRFDNWYDQESFIINMQSNFVQNEDAKIILQVAGNVEARSASNYGDDGVSQKVTISQGVASKADAIVPNPVTVIPYRTFLEVDQPSSQMVFRIRDNGRGPEFKLIEAEGGVWKNEAIHKIKKYMEAVLEELPDGLVTIIG